MSRKQAARARENAAFIKHLRRTGNVDLAAEAAGLPRHTPFNRRKHDPVFAADWAAALAFARAGIAEGRIAAAAAPGEDAPAITRGGEYSVSGSGRRRVQVRRAAPGRLTRAGERDLLAAVAATANVALAARSVGVSKTAIYQRAMHDTAFRRALGEAIDDGQDRLEEGLLERGIASMEAETGVFDAWREAAADQPAPLECMSVDQAISLLGIRAKQARAGPRGVAAHNRRRATDEETSVALKKALDGLKQTEERKAKREVKKPSTALD